MTSKELIAILLAIDPRGELLVRATPPRSGTAADPEGSRPIVGIGYDADDDAVNIYFGAKR